MASEERPAPAPGWQGPSLRGLGSLTSDALPGFEIIALDGIAAFVLGSALEPPYTIQHGSRVAGAILSAAADSSNYQPQQAPSTTPAIIEARASVLGGAHRFAARGAPGLTQLVNRIVSATVGELEIHKDSPEDQARSLFFYGMLAVASGPDNECSELAATGLQEVFAGWDGLIGAGFVPPWRVLDSAASEPVAD